METNTKDWVGALTLYYNWEKATVEISVEEVTKTTLTMDQAEHLSATLRTWVKRAQETGRTV